jgi:hypothetical protein
MHGGRMGGLAGLLVLALGGPGLMPSAAAAGRGRRSALEDRVSTLTKALALDAKQQVAVRDVLQRQRERVRRIWSDETVPSAHRIAMTKAVSRRTADEIRALLNEEQRKKYDPPPEGDAGAVTGSAHVEDWMKGGADSGGRGAR